jgi:hypothetical protein
LEIFNPGPSYPAQYHNWYLCINASLIGYFIGTGNTSILTGTMVTTATTFEAGGEVFSKYVNAPNDDVQMGSGFPAGNGFGYAAYHRDIYSINLGSGSGSICGIPRCANGYCYNAMPLAGNTGVCGYQATNFYSLSTTTAPGGSSSNCWGPYFYYGAAFSSASLASIPLVA